MEETRTLEEAKEANKKMMKALQLMEAVFLETGPEEWQAALETPEIAIPVGVPQPIYDLYKGDKAFLIDLVFHKIIIYGLRTLLGEMGQEEFQKRVGFLNQFAKGVQNARQGT